MSTLIQSWGRPVPKGMARKIAVTWGARAIYTGQHIDLLPDRQSWHVEGFSEDDADPTSATTRDSSVVRCVASLRNFHIEASPQASYGYLYIRAWEVKS